MQTYQTKIYVYTLTLNSTVDFPEYKLQTTYDIVLFPSQFKNLQHLKAAVTDRTGAGFLRSQFFRLEFRPDFEDKSTFLESSADLEKKFAAYKDNAFVDIVAVRYTRIQADQLMRLISKEEEQSLGDILRRKRVYTRRDADSQSFEEIKVDVAADDRIYKAFDCANFSREEMREGIASSKQGPYLTSELLGAWCDRVFDGSWNNLAVPPNEFPVIGGEIGDYVQVIVRNQLAGILNFVAARLNLQ